MFSELDFASVWAGVEAIFPTIGQAVGLAAAFWAAGEMIGVFRKLFGVRREGEREE